MRYKLFLMTICLVLVASVFYLPANQVAASELQPFEVYIQQVNQERQYWFILYPN
jgi:hypothetical protein